MDLGILLPILGLLFVVWVSIFLIYGQSWQLPVAFVPISLGSYFYYDRSPWDWLLLLPLLSLLVLNISAVLHSPKFKGWVFYLNYILVVPVIAVYIFYGHSFFKEDSIFKTIFSFLFQILLIFFVSKFWLSDVILLFINQLYSIRCNNLETEISSRFIKGTGRSKTFYVNIRALGAIETSGFFYLYVGLKNIEPNDKVRIKVKTGLLGTEYVSGFPKIISKSKII